MEKARGDAGLTEDAPTRAPGNLEGGSFQGIDALREFREGLLAYGATFFNHAEARDAARQRAGAEQGDQK